MDSLYNQTPPGTLPETNISIEKAILKMFFLFQRWDMVVPWRVVFSTAVNSSPKKTLPRHNLHFSAGRGRRGRRRGAARRHGGHAWTGKH